MQEQSFFHDALQKYGWNWKRFDQKEKKHTKLAGCSFEKNSRLFTIFPDFFQVWKMPGKLISRLFQEFKTLYEPCP